MKALNRHYQSFATKNIDEDKVKILIKLNIIRINSDVLTFMRENYPNQVIYLIEKNPKAYIENSIDEDNFLFNELLEILDTNIEAKYKIALLDCTNEPISVQDKQYDDSVEEYILKHNFNSADMSYLLLEYDNLAINSKSVIETLAKEHIEEICANEYLITYRLLLKVLSDETIDYDTRIEILSFSMSELNMVQCKKCLDILAADKYLSLFEGKRPKFEISEVNERILDVFEHNGWISQYKEYDEKYYSAIGRKQRGIVN